MHLDVLDLRNFYYRTRLGRAAQRVIRDQLKTWWPDTKGQTVVGFGFAVPLLRPFLGNARRVVGLMPGPQGVMPWPAGQPNVSVLCDEANWPIETGHIDRLVMMHGLETSEAPGFLLEECARCLGPGGRAVIVVPNRAGLWSRSDGTPFGYGRPYSMGQLEAQMKEHGFTPTRHLATLFALPSQKRFWLRAAPLMEQMGSQMPTTRAGGVLMLEVSKQPAPPGGLAVADAIRRPLRVLEGAPTPEGKPV
ncbi:MAG: class I SAM-dependent methyltransferase [Brevirhabdus sp.]